MVRRPAPPSASPGRDVSRSAPATRTTSSRPKKSTKAKSTNASAGSVDASTRRVDVAEWASGIRLSAFAVIMLSLVVLGAWVLVPTLGTFIDQRQKIAALEHSIQVSEGEIIALERERDRWQDPAYITTQARERLYYVKPGEVVYLIDNDLDPDALPQEPGPVSDTLEETPSDWMAQMLRTVAAAGLSETAAVAP